MSWIKRRYTAMRIIIYEIQNWFYVKKIIRQHKNTTDWSNYKLRADWIGRIYTVLNPDLPSDKGDTKEVLSYKYAERMKPIAMYLDKLGLGQAIYPAYEELPGTDSYLVVYSPIFNVLTMWKAFRFIGFWVIFFVTPADTYVWKAITWLYHAIIN